MLKLELKSKRVESGAATYVRTPRNYQNSVEPNSSTAMPIVEK